MSSLFEASEQSNLDRVKPFGSADETQNTRRICWTKGSF